MLCKPLPSPTYCPTSCEHFVVRAGVEINEDYIDTSPSEITALLLYAACVHPSCILVATIRFLYPLVERWNGQNERIQRAVEDKERQAATLFFLSTPKRHLSALSIVLALSLGALGSDGPLESRGNIGVGIGGMLGAYNADAGCRDSTHIFGLNVVLEASARAIVGKLAFGAQLGEVVGQIIRRTRGAWKLKIGIGIGKYDAPRLVGSNRTFTILEHAHSGLAYEVRADARNLSTVSGLINYLLSEWGKLGTRRVDYGRVSRPVSIEAASALPVTTIIRVQRNGLQHTATITAPYGP
ncbi:hypothetical protein CYLTODRAFT_415631 [Cylindrobasidium torrendii FP15055 ss-10]|uniref:Uncharacterized protein n=1 Tax=Cylindrobasidium torrendii FP15055 ss-10 TaxID=1314674 RepID=A0A0D7ASF6_9AGAR|nr:hypothetical protein CYLTODRAFT_415631 [Cylindrobasidium torrendii FP15055 ss-10]